MIIPLKRSKKTIDSYCDYFNKLENLWYEFERNSITEVKAQNKFYKIMSEEKDISKVVNEVIKGKNKKFQELAEEQSSSYFNNIFNQNKNE